MNSNNNNNNHSWKITKRMRARGKCIEFPSAQSECRHQNYIKIFTQIYRHTPNTYRRFDLKSSSKTSPLLSNLFIRFPPFLPNSPHLYTVIIYCSVWLKMLQVPRFFVFLFFTENPLFSRVWVTELSPTKYFVVFRFLRALTDSLLIAIHLHSNSLWTALTFTALGFNFLFNFCVWNCVRWFNPRS